MSKTEDIILWLSCYNNGLFKCLEITKRKVHSKQAYAGQAGGLTDKASRSFNPKRGKVWSPTICIWSDLKVHPIPFKYSLGICFLFKLFSNGFFSRPRRKIIHSSKLGSTRHQLYTNLHKKCIARISLTTYFPREHQPYFSGILGYPVFYDCDKKRTENEWYFCLIGDSVHTQFVSLLFSMQSHPRLKFYYVQHELLLPHLFWLIWERLQLSIPFL